MQGGPDEEAVRQVHEQGGFLAGHQAPMTLSDWTPVRRPSRACPFPKGTLYFGHAPVDEFVTQADSPRVLVDTCRRE